MDSLFSPVVSLCRVSLSCATGVPILVAYRQIDFHPGPRPPGLQLKIVVEMPRILPRVAVNVDNHSCFPDCCPSFLTATRNYSTRRLFYGLLRRQRDLPFTGKIVD